MSFNPNKTSKSGLEYIVNFYDFGLVCCRILSDLADCEAAVEDFMQYRLDGAVLTMDSTWNERTNTSMVDVHKLARDLILHKHADYCVEVVPAQL